MAENAIKIFLIIVVVIVAFGGGLLLRAFFTKRAMVRVIEIFYQHGAVGPKVAKTLQELGLQPPDFFQRMTRRRDYKQHALQILARGGLIVGTEEGKVYLVEEKVDEKLKRAAHDSLSHGIPS